MVTCKGVKQEYMIKQIRMSAGRRGRSRRNTLNLRKYSATDRENFTEDRNIAERSVCWVDSQQFSQNELV